MSDTTPTEFVHIDPATLVIGANARLDADLTADFIASIKQHGVLQTIDTYRNTDGALVVLRERDEQIAAARATLVEAGVRGAKPVSYDDKKARSLTRLWMSAQAELSTVIDSDEHAACPGHAAYVVAGWDGVTVGYVCTDSKQHGHVDRYGDDRWSTGGPMTDEQRQERREVERTLERGRAERRATRRERHPQRGRELMMSKAQATRPNRDEETSRASSISACAFGRAFGAASPYNTRHSLSQSLCSTS